MWSKSSEKIINFWFKSLFVSFENLEALTLHRLIRLLSLLPFSSRLWQAWPDSVTCSANCPEGVALAPVGRLRVARKPGGAQGHRHPWRQHPVQQRSREKSKLPQNSSELKLFWSLVETRRRSTEKAFLLPIQQPWVQFPAPSIFFSLYYLVCELYWDRIQLAEQWISQRQIAVTSWAKYYKKSGWSGCHPTVR